MQNLDQAIMRLDVYKHWTLKCVNRSVKRAGYSKVVQRRIGYQCTIWGDGKRVTAQAQGPLAAIVAAIGKLNDKTPRTKLKIVR